MIPIGTLLQVWLWWTLLLLGPEAAPAELSSLNGPTLLPGPNGATPCLACHDCKHELGDEGDTTDDDWFVAGNDNVRPLQRPTWAAAAQQQRISLNGGHLWLTDWHKRACPIIGPPLAA